MIASFLSPVAGARRVDLLDGALLGWRLKGVCSQAVMQAIIFGVAPGPASAAPLAAAAGVVQVQMMQAPTSADRIASFVIIPSSFFWHQPSISTELQLVKQAFPNNLDLQYSLHRRRDAKQRCILVSVSR